MLRPEDDRPTSPPAMRLSRLLREPAPGLVTAAAVTALGVATTRPPRGGRRSRVVHRVLAAAARRGGPVEKEILGLDAIVGPGAVCLDVGAEFGLYTHVLADLVGPTGVVHAFEPQRGAHRALAAGVRAAGLRQVHLHRVALGATTDTATLSVPRRHGLPVHGRAFVTTGAHDEGPNLEFDDRRHETVALTTVDDVVADLEPGHVALIKADVEGAEGALIDGALATISRHRPHLLLEIEERHTRKFGVGAADIFDRLTGDAGYVARTWSPVHGWHEVARVTDSERNYLFSPRESVGGSTPSPTLPSARSRSAPSSSEDADAAGP